MKAFWWFKENSIAGMARPGFNAVHWFDLPFEEALIFGWLGKFSCDSKDLTTLHSHIAEYGKQIAKFYQIDDERLSRLLKGLCDRSAIEEIFQRVSTKTNSLEDFKITDGKIHFKLNRAQRAREIEFLHLHKIHRVVCLTETHHFKDELRRSFDLHHLAINDLQAPTVEQARALAEIIQEAISKGDRVAVHCMAGIGRTSTMLMAAHLLLGSDFEELKAHVSRKNPAFKFVGPQSDFLKKVAGLTTKSC